MDKVRVNKRLISPNKIILPITENENGILDEFIQTNDKNCQEVFTCAICTCLAWEPLCCNKCDKAFCRSCLEKYGKNKKCPFQCDSSTFREMTRNEKNYLNKIKIKCTNVGCSKFIQYSDYLNHLEKCQLRKYHCKNQSCKEEGYFNDMINHSKNCQFRIVDCTKCKQYMKFCDLKNHQQEYCPETIIKCKLCGSSMKRGIYIKDHKSDKNENVKCLKMQVEKWTKQYNDDVNNKNKEINDLKNKIKDLEKYKRNYETENANLKKNMEELKQFLKKGFAKFFGEEKIERKNEIALGYNDVDSFINKDFLSTESSSFYSRNQNNRIIYKNNSIDSDKKKPNLKITILNNNISSCNSKDKLKDKAKEKIKERYLYHIKKVQSSSNLPSNYSSQTYASIKNNKNPFNK